MSAFVCPDLENGHLEIHPVTGISGPRNFQLLEDNRERQILPKVLVSLTSHKEI